MVAIYIGGQKVGEITLSNELRAALEAGEPIECRDDAGQRVRKYVAEPYCPWDPTLTREELDRRSAAGGGIPLAEFWKRMGAE
jgi:hypothetical protein